MPNEKETFIPLSIVKAAFDACCPACRSRAGRAFLNFQAQPKPLDLGPLHQLLEQIAIEHRIPIEEIKARSNMAYLVAVRREFSKKAREMGYSFPRIGHFLGRHHTSIIHLVNT